MQAPSAIERRAAMESARLLLLRSGRNCMLENECKRLVECSSKAGTQPPFDLWKIPLTPYPVVSVQEGLWNELDRVMQSKADLGDPCATSEGSANHLPADLSHVSLPLTESRMEPSAMPH